ncbi:DUF4231 domain-containing protein [Candidatus Gottesmanbacteria bacterium]|nr:DUF4231 domain-containing protein [Candidatus Gottesmanbacteria bacterium]
MNQKNYTLIRLNDQIEWYNTKSNKNHRRYIWFKIIEVVAAAFIPFLAGVNAPAILTASTGVLIVVLEGVQNLFQYHHNWITYRSTCENLKHEKYLYLAMAGPYLAIKNPEALLAERIESLISQEHSKWIASREKLEHTKQN